MARPAPPFEQLDYVYMPSRDVAADMAYFTDVLGGNLVFAIDGMGARVAMLSWRRGHRASCSQATWTVMCRSSCTAWRTSRRRSHSRRTAGRVRERTFDIPHGPCCSFVTPGGHRVALYQLTRPEAAGHFDGRRDF